MKQSRGFVEGTQSPGENVIGKKGHTECRGEDARVVETGSGRSIVTTTQLFTLATPGQTSERAAERVRRGAC